MRYLNWKTLLLLLIAVGLLAAAGSRIPPIEQMRRDMDLEPYNPFRDETVTAELRIPNAALTVFRSLAINYLWIRADNLKNEGQYFDALHLARLICALQPNLPSVWKFNAWNMAYNISVGLPNGPERWHWVRAGFELLRDEALYYNKTEMDLYRELAWIFQHKIGGITDDEHRYYKLRLAYEMMPLIGNGTNAEIAALAEAPRRWDMPSSMPFRDENAFTDPAALLVLLRDAREGTLPAYIREHFSAAVGSAVADYDRRQPPSLGLTLDVVAEFNRLLLDENLYAPERFAEVALTDEIRALIAANPAGWEVIPLNRLLLEAAFPELMAPQQRYRLDTDAEVTQLIEAMREVYPGIGRGESFFRNLANCFVRPYEYPEEFLDFLEANFETEAFRRLNTFVRARHLRRHWKIEPVWMMILNRRYGPIDYDNPDRRLALDWRVPFTHSLYWAVRGLQYAGDEISFDELNLQRMVYHSLQDLFHYGRMQIYVYEPPPEFTQAPGGQEVVSHQPPPQPRIFLSQDMRMFPVAYQATLDVIATRTAVGEKPPEGVIHGSLNLLRAGIVNYYLAGHDRLARRYYRELQRREPHRPEHQAPIERFVRDQMRAEAEQIGPRGASNYINALLRESYGLYAMYDDDGAAVREALARQVRDIFAQDFPGEGGDRMFLPEFGQLKWIALQDFLNDATINPAVKGALLQRLETQDPNLFQRVMDWVGSLQQQSQAPLPNVPR